MSTSWSDRWVKSTDTEPPVQGGQGVAFYAADRDDATSLAFIKTLRRQRSVEARKRFRREAAAYETVQGVGVPRLIEHNAHEWEDTASNLYIVLELVEGVNRTGIGVCS